MTDLQSTLDAIDEVAVHECGHCRRQLRPDGPSLDFCSPWCQQAWVAAKHEVQELVGYVEPDDLPEHAANLEELSSPEVRPARPDWLPEFAGPFGTVSDLRLTFQFDTTQIEAAIERASDAIGRLAEGFQRLREPIADSDRVLARLSDGWATFPAQPNRRSPRGFSPDWVIYDEISAVGILRNERSKPEPEPEPEPDEPPFGSDFDFKHTPAKALPVEPLPAVMPDLPTRDWQALIDARTTHTGPVRRGRAPRRLGRLQ